MRRNVDHPCKHVASASLAAVVDTMYMPNINVKMGGKDAIDRAWVLPAEAFAVLHIYH